MTKRKGLATVKITKNTGILAVGTVVVLPGGDEACEIREYRESTGRYRVVFLAFDGEDFVSTGEERYISPWELIGGETE